MLRTGVAITIVVFAISSLGGCALLPIVAGTSRAQLAAEATQMLKSDLANVAISAAEYATTNNGSYAGATLHELELSGLTPGEVPPGFTMTVGQTGQSYCAQGTTKYGQSVHDASGVISNGPC
jgi:hypothetical protein